MIAGLPSNTKLSFRLEFRRTGAASNHAEFNHCYLLVEPIL